LITANYYLIALITLSVSHNLSCFRAQGHGRISMTEAEWLSGRTIRMCNEWRELDRGETLKKKGKQGFAGKERQKRNAETEDK